MDNYITDLKPLSQLVNMEELYLGSNYITDLSPLVLNSGLSEDDYVSLENNPKLSGKSKEVYIPQLEGRGVEVNMVNEG